MGSRTSPDREGQRAAGEDCALRPRHLDLDKHGFSSTFALRLEQSKAVWSAGDYPRVAERFEPVAEELLDAVGEVAGLHLVDVAAGTGYVAFAAARVRPACWRLMPWL